ncbi:MAG: tRNA uridine-5-carboxymethylaminomethyl(34) synthesis enzyme MnmG, partial [Bacteroidota bacterium]
DETESLKEQRPCHITYTNPEVHEILRTGFDRSPMFNGRIRGVGPRYCPSIEDKIDRFSERDRHQIFVEPEGWDTVEVYVNGFSTSLPYEVQQKAMQKIPGFENAKMFRPGYAIEYDYFYPTQLRESLETKPVKGLFFAGQINGTTGYEEAACQGLMAGINAHQRAHEKDEFTLSRSEGYIGVLIDDLIHKGTKEPYRMFTSRAEYRILLRQDNADWRLTEKAHELGLADDRRLERIQSKKAAVEEIKTILREQSVAPEEANDHLTHRESSLLKQKVKIVDLLRRPNFGMEDLKIMSGELRQKLEFFDAEMLEEAEISIKYAAYVEKERLMVEKVQKLEHVKIKPEFDFNRIKSLSNEARNKLSELRPRTLGQASRISGVSPADVSVLMVYLDREQKVEV